MRAQRDDMFSGDALLDRLMPSTTYLRICAALDATATLPSSLAQTGIGTGGEGGAANSVSDRIESARRGIAGWATFRRVPTASGSNPHLVGDIVGGEILRSLSKMLTNNSF
jgi:hypothetical protein